MSNEFSVDLTNDYIALDLEDVPVWDGDQRPLDPGDYRVEVSSAKTEAASTGKPMLKVELKVVAMADGKSTAAEGRKLFNNYVMVGDTPKKRLKNFLVAAGAAQGNGFSVSNLVGRQLIVNVAHETRTYPDRDTGEQKTGTFPKVSRERAVG